MRLWRVFGHPYRRGRSLSADWKEHPHRLRLCDGIRRRQDPPHDEDLERRLGDARTGMGIATRNGGASPPDLSGWRTFGVDQRVQLVRDVAGDGRYPLLEFNVLVQ